MSDRRRAKRKISINEHRSDEYVRLPDEPYPFDDDVPPPYTQLNTQPSSPRSSSSTSPLNASPREPPSGREPSLTASPREPPFGREPSLTAFGRCLKCNIGPKEYHVLRVKQSWCKECTGTETSIKIPSECERCSRQPPSIWARNGGSIEFICTECKNADSELRDKPVKKSGQTDDCVVM